MLYPTRYLVHLGNGEVKEYTEEQIVANAKSQELAGVQPRYRYKSLSGDDRCSLFG